MEALSKIQLLVWSKPLPPYNTFIGSSGEDYPTALDLSTAMTLPPEAIQRFTVDDKFNISCRIDRDYSLNGSAFSNYLGAGKKLKNYYIDEDGKMTGSATRAMASQPNLKLKLLGLTNWATQLNGASNTLGPNLVFIPECTIGDFQSFQNWRDGVNRVYAPKLATVGGSFLENYNLNLNPNKKHVLYINSAISANSGVTNAVSKGAIVRIVTNYDTPNKVTDLSVSAIGAKHVKLNFTTPTAGTNPLDFYEVWFQKVGEFRPERKFLPSDAELTAPNQFVKNTFEPNSQYIAHICTVDTMYNGSGMFKDVAKRAISNEVMFTTLAQDFYINNNETTGYGIKIRILDYATLISNYSISKIIVYVNGLVNSNYNSQEYIYAVGLFKNTTYNIKIEAITQAGEIISNTISEATNDIEIALVPKCSGYYKLYTNSNDSSGNSRNGADTSMTYSGGYAKFGTGYIDIADNDAFSFTDGTNDISAHIAFGFIWNDKAGTQFFINKRGASSQGEWQIVSNGTVVRFFMYTANLSNFIVIDVPVSSITSGILNTLQFSYDGSKNHTGLKAYLNGASIGTSSLTGTYTGQVNGTSQVRIGAYAWANSNHWKADAKDIAIWKNRTMTPSEITEIDYRIKNNIPLI